MYQVTALLVAALAASTTPRHDTLDHRVGIEVETVVVDVVVRDKQGRFVPGLVADDFTVREDGKPIELDGAQEVHHALPVAEKIGKDEDDVRPAIASIGEPPPPRRFVVVLDKASVSRDGVPHFRRAVSDTLGWADRHLRPEDTVSVVLFDGQTTLRAEDQPYSPSLRGMIEALSEGHDDKTGSSRGDSGAGTSSAPADGLSRRIPTPGRRSVGFANTADRNMPETTYLATQFVDMLDWLASRLRHKRGRKAVVLLSEGHPLERQHVVRLRKHIFPRFHTADASIHTFNTIGVEARIERIDRLRQSFGRSASFTAGADVLLFAAEQTSGNLVEGTSNFSPGLEKISRELASYYRLSYTPPSQPSGSYHKIVVDVDRGDVEVKHRHGYYTAGVGEDVSDLENEREVTALLGSTEDRFDLAADAMLMPLATGSDVWLGVCALVPAVSLRGADATGVDLVIVAEVRDHNGVPIGGLDDRITIAPDAQTVQRVRNDGLEYIADLKVPAMIGELRLVIRDETSGAVRAMTLPFDVSGPVVTSYLVETEVAALRVRGNRDVASAKRRLALGDSELHPRVDGRVTAGASVFLVLDPGRLLAEETGKLSFELVDANGARVAVVAELSLTTEAQSTLALARLTMPERPAGLYDLVVKGQLGAQPVATRLPVVMRAKAP